MPVGILCNCLSIALGGAVGRLIGKKLSQSVIQSLMNVFAVCCLGIGISLIVQAKTLSAVILSVILGSFIGSLADIDGRLRKGVDAASAALRKNGSAESDDADILSLIVLFCFGTTTIIGALTEGMSGDPDILIMKSVLDGFTALIFACRKGLAVSLLAVPQFAVCIILYFIASVIMPYITPEMLCDFKACGGLITFATGLRMCGIIDIKSSDMLPSLFLSLLISWLWTNL